jgi:hypothetical protein
MPEAAHRIESPYEVEARYSTKRSMDWVGYEVHLTESCDEGFPHLITGVHTTAATATDVKQLDAIQDGLARSGLLPAFQLADASYVCGSNLVSSHARHKIDLIGPSYKDNTWQAKADQGFFDVATFRIDWETKMVTCPEERKSIRWSKTKTARGRGMIHIDFSPDDCSACPSRPICTRARNLPRPHPAAKRRARGYPVCQKAPKDRGVRLPLLPEGGHRRDGLTRSKGSLAAPGSLPGLGENPPAGGGHRRGDQRESAGRLAERNPCRYH